MEDKRVAMCVCTRTHGKVLVKRDRKERSQRRLLGRSRDGIWARRSTEVLVFEVGFGE